MHVLASLLLPLLQLCSQARAMSLPTETVRMKLRVESMADQLLHKLERVEIPETLTSSQPSDQQHRYNVCSMVQYLNMSSSLISNSFNKSQEIKSELASLSGFVDQSCHCSGRPRPPAPKELVALQGRKTRYPDGVTLRVYHLLKKYLKNLDKNQLDVC